MPGARLGKGVVVWHSCILVVGGQIEIILGKSVRRSVTKDPKNVLALWPRFASRNNLTCAETGQRDVAWKY